MAAFDDEEPKKPPVHALGQDLSRLSLEELDERVELLKAEIIRLEAASESKRASANVADSFFKS
ncbi:MAG: DUF1192 domain-containing protein [Hyphomicrobiales bacterium]|nr:DUF1192 domain-containing protein [Hyphomicrobiales bacterium]